MCVVLGCRKGKGVPICAWSWVPWLWQKKKQKGKWESKRVWREESICKPKDEWIKQMLGVEPIWDWFRIPWEIINLPSVSNLAISLATEFLSFDFFNQNQNIYCTHSNLKIKRGNNIRQENFMMLCEQFFQMFRNMNRLDFNWRQILRAYI